MKKQIGIYIGALALAVVSALNIPMVLRIIFCAIPLLFFGYRTLMGYMTRIKRRLYINEYLTALIAALAELCCLKFVYAAMTLIFFDAIVFFFSIIERSSRTKVNTATQIFTPTANVIINGKLRTVPTEKIHPEQIIVLKEGDIIPVDGIVTKGTALIDYSNIFGPGDFIQTALMKPCYSGGAVQSGEIYLTCKKTFADSYANTLLLATKKANRPSQKHRKVVSLASLIQITVMVLAVIAFVISLIVSKSFSRSINIAAVILVISGTAPLLSGTATLYRNFILNLRNHGLRIRDEQAIDALSKVEAVGTPREIDSSLRNSLESNGIVVGEHATEEKIAFIYRSEEQLQRVKNRGYKIGLGFSHKRISLTVNDSNPNRLSDAFRIAKNFKNVFFENLICILVEKVIVLLLLFLVNIHATDAMILEFVASIVCILNSAKFFS